MSFDSDEKSIAGSKPIDLYTIVTPITTYYLTSSQLDLVVGGITYSATTIQRDNAVTPNATNGARQLTVTVALPSALAQDLLVGGIPYQDVTLTVVRYQQVSASTWGFFQGHIVSLKADGANLLLTVQGKLDDYFVGVKLPIASSQRLCQHALYDAGCTIARSGGFVVATTVSSVTGAGLTVNVGSVGGNPNEYFQYGELVRAADGARRSIVDQTGSVLTIDVPFRTLNTSDAITLYAGCDHQVTTCLSKFANVVNFGGHPNLPTSNIQSPTGFGQIIQS